MFRKYVIKALAKFYKLSESTSVEELEKYYEKNRKALPELELAAVFKALKQSPSLRFASDDRNLYHIFGNVIAAINMEESNSCICFDFIISCHIHFSLTISPKQPSCKIRISKIF